MHHARRILAWGVIAGVTAFTFVCHQRAVAQVAGEAPAQTKTPLDPKLLRALADKLHGKNYEEASAALATLAKLIPTKADQGTEYGPLLEPLFRRAGWGGIARTEARVAEDLLVRIGKPALPMLKQCLESEDAHDRRVAIELLVRIGPLDESLAALLRRLLPDRDAYVRRKAMEGLATIGPPAKEAITDLESLANIELDHTRRVSARVALIRIAGASEERVRTLADFLEPMIFIDEPMAKDRKTGLDFEAARFAASELGKLGLEANSASRKLLAALKHKDHGIRGGAVAALADVGATSPETVAALIAILKDDPEREVRRLAASSLGTIGPKAKNAIPILRASLKGDGNRGWWVAAEALGKIGGPDVVPGLIEGLTSPDEGVRAAAMKWLGNLGSVAKSAVKDLEKASKMDEREHNRTAAMDALRRIEQSIQDMKHNPPKR